MRLIKHKVLQIVAVALLMLASPLVVTPAFAQKQCGNGDDAMKTSIDFGCKGDACTIGTDNSCNPIVDLTFAIIRFLTNGVGLVVVGSLIFAGIQFSSSRGDPKASEMAQARIQSSLLALLLFIFSYYFLNYLLPAGFAHL